MKYCILKALSLENRSDIHMTMAKRVQGVSPKRMPKGPHKTKKRLAMKKAMLTAKAAKKGR